MTIQWYNPCGVGQDHILYDVMQLLFSLWEKAVLHFRVHPEESPLGKDSDQILYVMLYTTACLY